MIATILLLAAIADDPAEKLGEIKHPGIREPSGIVKSRRHPGIFWVHNDSGNPPSLFAVTKKGKVVREYKVDAPNLDWEDIAADNDGHLYLGDIGNNGERLPLRAIYRLDEPDPAIAPTAALKPSLVSFYRFPKSKRFDAEGLFFDGGKAIVVSKYLDGKPADLFAISLDPAGTLLQPVLPEKIATLEGFTRPATGASLSEDGRWLAVCSIQDVRVYAREPGKPWEPKGSGRCPEGQVEAVTWDGMDVILLGEDGRIHRVPETSWRPKRGDKRDR